MNIRLLAFASAGDALGTTEMDLEMPEGSRIADLRARLDADHPGLRPLWPRLAVAIDGRVVTPDEPLTPGAEVALLPPVSGGSGKPSDRRADLVDGPIDTDAVVATVAGPGRGAILTFLGTVRDSHGGRGVEKLIYSAYRTMALEGLERIVADLEASSPACAPPSSTASARSRSAKRASSSPSPPPTAPPPTRPTAPPSKGSRPRSPSGSASTTRKARRSGGKRSRWCR